MQNTAIFQHTPPLYTRGKVLRPRLPSEHLLFLRFTISYHSTLLHQYAHEKTILSKILKHQSSLLFKI